MVMKESDIWSLKAVVVTPCCQLAIGIAKLKVLPF